ncbi:MAG: signal peptide peptidase SppA [Mucilaginibacter polytrichastri]|nr:signal peptide peptidase SppA [Mucilaginibacter polytrichastri]
MKQFFKFVFATVVGVVLCVVVLVVVLIGMVAVAGKEKKTAVEDNSILHVDVSYAIPERTVNSPLADFGFLGLGGKNTLGLNDILSNIRDAKTDNRIKGIFLDSSFMMSGFATMEEIRNALIDFRSTGKFIIAYSEIYSQGAYYLASVADKVYLNPEGYFRLTGFNAEHTFFKNALDKVGVEMQVIKVGTYKSAVEPFILDKMSEPNRMQVNAYLESLYGHFLGNIGKSRKIPADSLRSWANTLKIRYPKDALKYKLVDGLKYKDQVLDEMKKMTNTDLKDDLQSVTLADYAKADRTDSDDKGGSGRERIAVVYASGDIVSGKGDDNSIGSETVSQALRKVRLDKKVKAVVFRVNSGGGSSLASEVIWREVDLTRKVKPVIVSMGDYAASGGYYIAAAADSIFAQPNTITGSIGIFGLYPNMQNLLNNKLGITFDNVKTGKYADLGDVSRPLSVEERAILQDQVNAGYQTFLTRVASGRKKTTAQVDSIGQGRVWTGTQALKIGLVDRIGSFNDAIVSAAKKAKLKTYRVVSYPEQKKFLENFTDDAGKDIQTRVMQSQLGENYGYWKQLQDIMQTRGVQAQLPYRISIR